MLEKHINMRFVKVSCFTINSLKRKPYYYKNNTYRNEVILRTHVKSTIQYNVFINVQYVYLEVIEQL